MILPRAQRMIKDNPAPAPTRTCRRRNQTYPGRADETDFGNIPQPNRLSVTFMQIDQQPALAGLQQLEASC